MGYIGMIMALMIGMTFLLSGGAKLSDLQGTARITMMMGILPKSIAKIVGPSFPFVEIVVGALLLTGVQPLLVSVVAQLMIVSFLIINGKAIVEGKDIACNCFGRLLSGKIGLGGLFHSIILFGCGLIVIFYHEISFVSFVQHASYEETLTIVFPAIVLMVTGLLSREVQLTT